MSLKEYAIFSLLFFNFININIFSKPKYNQLTNIVYSKKELSDIINYKFKEKPYYFSDYVRNDKFINMVKDKINIDNINLYEKELFFIPYVSKSRYSNINSINKLDSNVYIILSFYTLKPVKGIYIAVIYDPKMVNFEHGFSQLLDSKEIVFKFYDNDKLNYINDNTSPLRWIT